MSDFRSEFGRHRTQPRGEKGMKTKRGGRGHRGASASGKFSFSAWLRNHAEVARESWLRMLSTPTSSLLTMAVIGIALSLPAAFHVLIENVLLVSDRWERSAQLNLFLNPETQDAAAKKLARDIRQRIDVESVELIDRDEAMAEFREQSGFGDALDLLDSNPLPAVLVVRPVVNSGKQLDNLIADLGALPSVDIAAQDRLWLERLQAILDTLNRIVVVIASLLGTTVIIVVGNTIRLEIENKRHEIEVIKLVGGTDAFVRRPFIYAGLWYGLCGGVLAVVLVIVALLFLEEPAARLSGLYQSSQSIQGLGLTASAAILGLGALCGWLGAWFAVGRHIRYIEPV